MGREVRKGQDGFWRVEGLDEDHYYATEATAKRVAAGLDQQDAERHSDRARGAAPATAPKK
jgi:hypothetical protein